MTSTPGIFPFPCPEHKDPSMCRDEFLSTFIEEHETRAESIMPRSTIKAMSVIQGLEDSKVPELEKGAEAMVVLQLARQRQKGNLTKTVEQFLEAIRMRPTLLADLNRQIQKAAIEFLSVRLLKQLRLFSSPWPGELEEIPYHLFSWSLDNFMTRLDVKQMYLDVINRERSVEDLDCHKFCKDLSEIELLIYEIRQDYRDDKDLCKNSLKSLRSAQYNTNAPWVKTLERNLRIIENDNFDSVFFNRTSSFKMLHRHTSVMGDFESSSALDPIEMRYQINWIRSCTEQRLFRINGREDAMREGLKDLKEQMMQDESVQYSSELMYSLELGKLRASIRDWQERQDTDLEKADVMCTVSKLALQKVKDDLKFYMEQKEMYLRRLEEVQAVIALENKAREQKESAERLSRKSERKSARMSVRKSLRKSEIKSERKSEIKSERKSISERKSERMSERKSRNSKAL
uniref:Uncharacterized protein LOC108042576 n=1 Tax=Drosophila rhopaloa TaxID=1041015 RepID=A0A6P4EE51_DRORH